MKINCVEVSNYRNIDGISVCFNPDCNYIIGENNLGKSNFLSLLSTVCNGKSFDEIDFADPEKAIGVELEVQLCQNEQGFFGDNFSPEDSSLLKIRYSQTIQEAYPTIVCTDSEENLPAKLIRKINFLKYETTSVPSKELKLDSQNGAGLLIKEIIEKFIADDTPEFLNNDKVGELMNSINVQFEKIRSFHDYPIKATFAANPIEMLTSLFYLSDGERKIDTAGSGVQYVTMASINLLGQIMKLYKSKSVPFDELVYTNNDGKKLLPMILAIDEPEVHLHPYLQRSLIGYYKKILRNKDNKFIELLKYFFNLDGIDGQLIIVTHSTDVLVGDYRDLIRFYKTRDGNAVAVVSGYELRPHNGTKNEEKIKSADEKHLIMHFFEIKEAFYSKCVLLVEGETEYGCIHAFAEKIGIELDDNGICVINARGEASIKPIRQLLSLYKIPSIAIYDGDVKNGQAATDIDFFTNELCFEIEVVKKLFVNSQTHLIRKIILDLESDADTVELDENFVRKHFNKMGHPMEGYSPKKLSDINDDNEDEFCAMYSAWFMAKKGVLLGRIIGESLPAEYIPECYKNALKKAQEVAMNG